MLELRVRLGCQTGSLSQGGRQIIERRAAGELIIEELEFDDVERGSLVAAALDPDLVQAEGPDLTTTDADGAFGPLLEQPEALMERRVLAQLEESLPRLTRGPRSRIQQLVCRTLHLWPAVEPAVAFA